MAFWLQPDEKLNRQLRFLLESITVDLRDTVAASKVVSIRCRTAPAEAPLPKDQNKIVLKSSSFDLKLLAQHCEAIEAALKAIG